MAPPWGCQWCLLGIPPPTVSGPSCWHTFLLLLQSVCWLMMESLSGASRHQRERDILWCWAIRRARIPGPLREKVCFSSASLFHTCYWHYSYLFLSWRPTKLFASMTPPTHWKRYFGKEQPMALHNIRWLLLLHSPHWPQHHCHGNHILTRGLVVCYWTALRWSF